MIVYCENCQANLACEIAGSLKYCDDWQGGEPLYLYSLVKCLECGHPKLIIQMYLGSDIYDDPHILYPRTELTFSSFIPADILKNFKEAQDCFKFGLYTPSVIMCRLVLEAICHNNSCTGSTLIQKLEDLKNKNIINDQLYEWVDALRLLGNIAAHDFTSTVKKEDSKDVLDLIHAIIEYIYNFQIKFNEFKQRKGL